METRTSVDAAFALAAYHPDTDPEGAEQGKRVPARLVELNAGCQVSFSIHVVHAILEQPAPEPVPGMAPYGYGLLVWQGGHIPMIDLFALVHGTAATGPVPYALVVGYRDAGGGKKYGAIGLSALPSSVQVANEDQCALPSDSPLWPKLALSCFNHDGKAVPVIDAARVFGFHGHVGVDCT